MVKSYGKVRGISRNLQREKISKAVSKRFSGSFRERGFLGVFRGFRGFQRSQTELWRHFNEFQTNFREAWVFSRASLGFQVSNQVFSEGFQDDSVAYHGVSEWLQDVSELSVEFKWFSGF